MDEIVELRGYEYFDNFFVCHFIKILTSKKIQKVQPGLLQAIGICACGVLKVGEYRRPFCRFFDDFFIALRYGNLFLY